MPLCLEGCDQEDQWGTRACFADSAQRQGPGWGRVRSTSCSISLHEWNPTEFQIIISNTNLKAVSEFCLLGRPTVWVSKKRNKKRTAHLSGEIVKKGPGDLSSVSRAVQQCTWLQGPWRQASKPPPKALLKLVREYGLEAMDCEIYVVHKWDDDQWTSHRTVKAPQRQGFPPHYLRCVAQGWHLLPTRICAKFFISITSLTFHRELFLFLSSPPTWGSSPERFSNLPNITQPLSGKGGIWSSADLTSKQMLLSTAALYPQQAFGNICVCINYHDSWASIIGWYRQTLYNEAYKSLILLILWDRNFPKSNVPADLT